MHPRAGRYAESGLRTSLLSAPGAVGAEAVGLRPIGEVMGCVVARSEELTSGLRHGYATALDRLRAEASALGADGVLAIACTVTRVSATVREFTVLGTAVRAERGVRPARPFTTGLPGPDVAKLLYAGWVPVTVAIGIDGGTTYDIAMRDRPGEEVRAPTELVTRVRAGARAEFTGAVAASGADGGLVTSTTLRAWRLGPTGVGAVTSVFGTAVAQVGAGARRGVAGAVLPLSDE
ncbi:YbjQ family protein [Amycolatopsis sp. OK19-0408]|uniref:YbjQ family protein n=1 Tax=Amycolatopsis iheyensis TaxID=2945988 RepID=A0A9X2NIX8_9PSEU|nr:YbjQ family protein [Amycolatopsis iheyensis]MCR6487595.1 YbjQ family protein [Amycolatopsis iheyensis]